MHRLANWARNHRVIASLVTVVTIMGGLRLTGVDWCSIVEGWLT